MGFFKSETGTVILAIEKYIKNSLPKHEIRTTRDVFGNSLVVAARLDGVRCEVTIDLGYTFNTSHTMRLVDQAIDEIKYASLPPAARYIKA